MNLRQIPGLGKPKPMVSEKPKAGVTGRYMTLMAEGVAANVPDIGGESYREFRTNMNKLALQIPDRLPENDKLKIIQDIIREFERYRKAVDDEFRERRIGWRSLTTMLLRYVLGLMNIDPASAEAAPLVQRIGSLLTGAETQAYPSSWLTFFV